MSNDVRSASITLLKRCADILEQAGPAHGVEPEGCGRAHLLWMCASAKDHASSWPIDKLSRWLGFIQSAMTFQGLLNVEEERDFSRPLFHAAYRSEGLAPPSTLGPAKA